MRKTSVIAAVAAGFVGWCSVGSLGIGGGIRTARAQAPDPEPPVQPDAADAVPSPSDAPPSDAAPGAEPPSSPPSPAAPLDNALFPNPALDSRGLQQQGEERPDARREGGSVTLEDIFAEDWWSHARPIFEFHGYFRTRAQLFHNFSLGRRDAPNQALYPQPPDNQFQSVAGNMLGNVYGPILCTSDESDSGTVAPDSNLRGCQSKTQAGANLRFRLNPQIHVSDNLRINSQVDILDNLVFGSTPEGYELRPGESGYVVAQRSGYLPNSYLDATQSPPSAGLNGLEDSIRVKRAWAEYTTPLGEIRFGRMPNHWGLGMVHNSGDGYDDDAQSTVDRLMVTSGIKLLDLVIAGMWDFPNEGATYRAPFAGSEAYDRGQLDDVSQYGLIVMRNKSPELTKLELSRGNLVLNTGLFLTYRDQLLANDQNGPTGANGNVPDADAITLANGYSRRGASVWMPDVWLQLLYKKLRVEAEVAAVVGSIESLNITPDNGTDFIAGAQAERKLRQYGFAFELTQKLVEDRLRLNFRSGWASGDPDAFDPDSAGNLIPGGAEQQVNDDTISTFRFHPSYRVDMILNRNILQRVQGTYYFNPSLEYDFTREPNGQRIGGGVNVVWTRASEFVQTPGHANDLGLELGGALYFQSKDGALNDDMSQPGGFFAQLQYSVLFPLDGLGYQAATETQVSVDTSAAQLLRLYLGVMF